MLTVFSFLSGCGGSNTTGGSNKDTDTATGSSARPLNEPLKGCYLAVIKQDTIQLAITKVDGNNIEGTLTYNFAEKDRSKGTFSGEYNGGILSAKYVFNSEGTTSERPVIFRRVPEGFVEGFGETRTEGDKEVFADLSQINFEQSYTLKRTGDCLP